MTPRKKNNLINTQNEESAVEARDLIKHENDLIDQRLTWLIALQGLLFAALGFAWDKRDAQGLIAIFCFLGTATSISVAFALWGGAAAIERLSKIEAQTRHMVIGRKSRSIEKIFYPWFTFPVLFAITWLLVLWFNWHR